MQENYSCGVEDWDKIRKNISTDIKNYTGDLLYKYRSLDLNRNWINSTEYKTTDNLERVIEILKSNKIYVPKLKSVNDPFEGRYMAGREKQCIKQLKRKFLLTLYLLRRDMF